jgi:hypothetical protein
MPPSFLQPRYVIDCSALNRYFWFRLDGSGVFKNRRDAEVKRYGETHIKKALQTIEVLIESGEIISHVEVRDEIRNSGFTEWNRWTLKQRRMFKDYSKGQDAKMHEIAQKHSLFLAQDKKDRAKHADPWVLAQAMEKGLSIIAVDDELADIARQYGVNVIAPFDLLKNEEGRRLL